jgi:hypothetical protein
MYEDPKKTNKIKICRDTNISIVANFIEKIIVNHKKTLIDDITSSIESLKI